MDWKYILTSSSRISVCSIACKKVSINQVFVDLSLTSTSLWKRLVAKLKVSRASPVRTTSWLLQRGAVLDFVKKNSHTRLSS